MEMHEEIQLWQRKKELQRLAEAEGASTSLISLLIPNKPGSLNKVTQLLTTEYGTASQIKSSATRNAVLDALRALQQRVKSIN